MAHLAIFSVATGGNCMTARDVPAPEAPVVSFAPSPRAKALPRRLPFAGAPPELVPARMINEVRYCERLLYLEWAQGEFEDNAFTVEGRSVHRRADKPGGALPPVPAAPGSETKAAPGSETKAAADSETKAAADSEPTAE